MTMPKEPPARRPTGASGVIPCPALFEETRARRALKRPSGTEGRLLSPWEPLP